VKPRILVTVPFDHVILRLTEKTVLWSKERSKAEKIAIVSLQNSRRVFKPWGNGSRMKQGTDARTAEFVRPEFAQMIEWQFNGHGGFLKKSSSYSSSPS